MFYLFQLYWKDERGPLLTWEGSWDKPKRTCASIFVKRLNSIVLWKCVPMYTIITCRIRDEITICKYAIFMYLCDPSLCQNWAFIGFVSWTNFACVKIGTFGLGWNFGKCEFPLPFYWWIVVQFFSFQDCFPSY